LGAKHFETNGTEFGPANISFSLRVQTADKSEVREHGYDLSKDPFWSVEVTKCFKAHSGRVGRVLPAGWSRSKAFLFFTVLSTGSKFVYGLSVDAAVSNRGKNN
jgi:hypothetical protein